MPLSFHLGDSDLSKSSSDTFTIISFETAGQGRTDSCRSHMSVFSRPPAPYVFLLLLHLNPSDTVNPVSGGLMLGNTKCIVRVTH